MMGYLKSGITGFISGCIGSLIFNQWIFLEMRININLLIPVFSLGGIALYHIKGFKPGIRLFLILEIGLITLVSLLFGLNSDSYLIIPASMFRDGFFLTSLSLGEINLLLIAVFLAGNSLFFTEVKNTFDGVLSKTTDPD